MDKNDLVTLLVVLGVGYLGLQFFTNPHKNDCHIQLEQMQREFGSYRDAIRDARQ